MVQLGDLVQIWGNLPLMVNTSFLLFTNCALAAKIIVVGWRSQAVQHIIDDGDHDIKTMDTGEGKSIIKNAEKNSLPLRAWLATLPQYLTQLSNALGTVCHVHGARGDYSVGLGCQHREEQPIPLRAWSATLPQYLTQLSNALGTVCRLHGARGDYSAGLGCQRRKE
ncbi:Odorant receptor 56 [Operophtera brumata]|uniref:Odorant receptor 56 n=1 Tax=Operophtera brumata TaxID=104452 RepID=A0A0L7L3S6_OPEBR|nr:Odorant receptor 56 [Operophtera brumata]